MIRSGTSYVVYDVGGVSVFPVPFELVPDSELHVSVKRSTGARDDLAEGTDWVYDSAAKVVTVTAALNVGDIVTIQRYTPSSQTNDLHAGRPINPDTLEIAYDKGAAVSQEIRDIARRALTVPLEDGTDGVNLPSVEERKGMMLGFDGQGDAVAIEGIEAFHSGVNTAVSAAARAAATLSLATEVEAKANEYRKEAEASASAANAVRDGVVEYAVAASASASSAATSLESARTAEASAQRSMSEAANSATSAASARDSAVMSQQAADRSAQSARASADAAAIDAASARNNRTSAEASATNAAISASASSTSARAAATHASNAEASETAAKESADKAGASEKKTQEDREHIDSVKAEIDRIHTEIAAMGQYLYIGTDGQVYVHQTT